MDDFWAIRRSLGAIKIARDSLDDVLHDPIICVSRSGKFTAFYIAYISYIVERTSTAHTVKSHANRI